LAGILSNRCGQHSYTGSSISWKPAPPHALCPLLTSTAPIHQPHRVLYNIAADSQEIRMGAKRKRTIAVRESHPSKHRSATPAAETPTPEEQTSVPEVPTSFTKDGPLPVIPQRQSDGLLLSDYKSVAERFACHHDYPVERIANQVSARSCQNR